MDSGCPSLLPISRMVAAHASGWPKPRSVALIPMTSSDITLIIVPRERFSRAVDSLKNIIANTPPGYELVYVTDGGPSQVMRELHEICAKHQFRFIQMDRRSACNKQRNHALQFANRAYVAFLDNDVFVQPGWLDALLRCAMETSAWIVGPLYLYGELSDSAIHMAGGDARIVVDGGIRRYHQSLRHVGKHTHEVELVRENTGQVEFHCMLVNTERLRQLGGLDESLINSRDHDDICMRIRAAGGKVYFEPAARIAYNPNLPLKRSEYWYYWTRWSENWNMQSLLNFSEKWELDWRQNPQEKYHLRWCREKRQRLFWPLVEYTKQHLGPRWSKRIWRRLFKLEVLLSRLLVPAPRPSSGFIKARSSDIALS